MDCAMDARGWPGRLAQQRVQMCSACRGDYEDPDAAADAEEEAGEGDKTWSFPRDAIQGMRGAGEDARKGEARRIDRCGEAEEGV